MKTLIHFSIFSRKSFWLIAGILLTIFTTACSATAPIAQVTPFVLPTNEPTVNIPPTATPAPATNTPIPLLQNTPAIPPTPFPHVNPTVTLSPFMQQDVPRGQALAHVRATDQAIGFEQILTFEEDPVVLTFDEFFVDYNPNSNQAPVPSEKLFSLDGKRVVIEGYMAPPLQLGLDWFMLTRQPIGACPFHSSVSTWTPDIILVYVEGTQEHRFSWDPLRIEGTLEIGGVIDPTTGMASLIRLYTDEKGVETVAFSQ